MTGCARRHAASEAPNVSVYVSCFHLLLRPWVVLCLAPCCKGHANGPDLACAAPQRNARVRFCQNREREPRVSQFLRTIAALLVAALPAIGEAQKTDAHQADAH